jgi:hypothetical protein
MRYTACWARFWSLVGAIGVGLSFLVWKPVSVLTVFLTAVLCVGVLLVLVAPAAGPDSPLATVRWSRIATRAGLAGAGVVALGAFCATLPALALPLASVALLSSPWFVERVQSWRDLGPADAAPAPPSIQDAGAPRVRPVAMAAPTSRPAPGVCRLDVTSAEAEAMTDRELCREWRQTFVALQSARSPHELLRVVAQRQVYMDEMERRRPNGLEARRDSGARAAGGPERFLTHQPRTDDQSDAA